MLTKLRHILTSHGKFLYSLLVAIFTHVQKTVGILSDGNWKDKLSGTVALSSEHMADRAVRIKDHDAMIVSVGDGDLSIQKFPDALRFSHCKLRHLPLLSQLALAVVDEHSARIVQNKHVIVGVRIESSRSRQESSGGWNLPRIKTRHRELRLLIVTGAADNKTQQSAAKCYRPENGCRCC